MRMYAILSQYYTEGNKFLHHMSTGDKPWIHHYESGSNHWNVEQQHPITPFKKSSNLRKWQQK
jgi:hypothetical protein